MNLLGALVLARLLRGDEADRLDRLVRRVADAQLRPLLESMMAASVEDRQSTFDQCLGMTSHPELLQDQLNVAQKHMEYLEEECAKVLREPPGVTLATASVELGNVRWLWPGWIPMGAVSMIIGNSGVGKSHVVLRIAQSVISGEPWPDGSPVETNGETTRRVAWIDTEARYALLNERAERWGLPRDRIQWPLDPENVRKLTPNLMLDDAGHWQAICDYLNDWRPALTVVDSLSGGHDADENKEHIKAIMRRMAELSADLGLGLLVVHHTRKAREGEAANLVQAERARGHGSHTQWPMSVIVLDKPDPEQDRLRLRVDKANLTVAPPPLGVTIEDDGVACDTEAPGTPKAWSSSDDARAMLEARTSTGAARVTELRSEAQERGIPWFAVQRMRKQLGLVAIRRGESGRPAGGFWVWARPTQREEPR